MLVYGAGAGDAFFCLEPGPTQFERSRSRLRDLGLLEPAATLLDRPPSRMNKLS